ncbi:hypothetical protein [Streptomyces bauhiniae]
MPRTEQRAHCPACRSLQAVRQAGKGTIGRQAVTLVQCLAPACELVWAVPTRSTT